MFFKICLAFSFSNLWMLIHFLDGAFSISRSFKFLWSLHLLFYLFMVCAFCVLPKKSLTPRLQRYSLCFLYLVELQLQKVVHIEYSGVFFNGYLKNKGFIRLLQTFLEEGMATHSGILAWRIPIERGTWQSTVHGVEKSQTQLSS